MKVDFMIIGAQKSGTTSLAEHLKQHPQICFSKIKEPHYFSNTANWNDKLHEYHNLFDPKINQICGEASTSYTFKPINPDTASRLYEYNKDLKLIYIMRDPIDRINSHYMHKLSVLTNESSIDLGVLINSHYLNVSRYGMQLETYLELFPRKNLLLLIFEEFMIDYQNTHQKLSDFLDIDRDGFKNIKIKSLNMTQNNKFLREFYGAKKYREISKFFPEYFRKYFDKHAYKEAPAKIELNNSTKRILWRSLVGEVEVVEQLLGRRLDIWRDKHTY